MPPRLRTLASTRPSVASCGLASTRQTLRKCSSLPTDSIRDAFEDAVGRGWRDVALHREFFNLGAGTRVTHIPYGGSGPARSNGTRTRAADSIAVSCRRSPFRHTAIERLSASVRFDDRRYPSDPSPSEPQIGLLNPRVAKQGPGLSVERRDAGIDDVGALRDT